MIVNGCGFRMYQRRINGLGSSEGGMTGELQGSDVTQFLGISLLCFLANVVATLGSAFMALWLAGMLSKRTILQSNGRHRQQSDICLFDDSKRLFLTVLNGN